MPEEPTSNTQPENSSPKDDELEKMQEPTAADAAEPEAEPTEKKSDQEVSHLHRFKLWYTSHQKWTIPASVLVLILLIGLVPWTRYHSLGLVLKKDFTLSVSDASSGSPVSGATISVDGKTAETNGSGQAKLHLAVGSHTFNLTKKYYQNGSLKITVPILKEKTVPLIKLTATGRQVKVSINNLINKKALADAEIDVGDVKAKTDKSGNALLVLPANLTQAQGILSLSGYNDAKVTVKISSQTIEQNNFTMTPAGKVYFLSKLSGKIDVVKTNLDGSARQTVIAGTGKEDDTNTVLLASRDWKYLALLSQRDSAQAKLYVINTTDDKLLTMDEGNADFSPVGWYNHYFVYSVSRLGFNSWQPNASSLKSYNADSGQPITLVNSNATGSGNADANYETVYGLIMGGDVVYTRTWYRYPGYLDVSGKQNVLAAIHPDGTASRQLKSVDAANSYFSNLWLNKPRELDLGVYSISGSAATTYWVLDKNGNLSQNSSLTDQSLAGEQVSYLASPSGAQVFWQEERDGKNTLFLGDQDAANPKQIATLSSFNSYGWYSDDYLLVSKNSSELYVIAASGIKDDSKALKITDYHKPARSFYGYGGGYGGL